MSDREDFFYFERRISSEGCCRERADQLEAVGEFMEASRSGGDRHERCDDRVRESLSDCGASNQSSTHMGILP
jgi:hypothetical protein